MIPIKGRRRYMTPYARAWDMGPYTEYMSIWYMTVYDGICQVVRIPDARRGRA